MSSNRRQVLQIIAGSLGACTALLLRDFTPALAGSNSAVARPLSLDRGGLIDASTSYLLEHFQRRELSPVEVLEAQVERYSHSEPLINARTETHVDSARKAAKESEERDQKRTARPLEGITVVLKDEYDVKGWLTTAGSKVLKANVASSNHPAVDKLMKAGAVLHLQTTIPEMSLAGVAWTDL